MSNTRTRVSLHTMDLTALDVPDDSFDAVVATFVFGCIPDALQARALSEVARVCRPDGEIRLLDYTMSRRPLVRLGMEVMSPWLAWAFGGTYRPTTTNWLGDAGLELVDAREMAGDATRLIVLRPVGSW